MLLRYVLSGRFVNMRQRLDEDFLRHIVEQAAHLSEGGIAPAPSLAAKYGTTPRTVHAWIRKAYQCGVAESPGRGVRANWYRVKCEHCDGQGYINRETAP